MLVVISHPEALKNEASLINKLFDAGMHYFHIRKPDGTEQEVKRLIADIDPKYHAHLSLHQYHYLAPKYGIHRLHFPALQRRDLLKSEAPQGYLLSTSCHSEKEFTSEADQKFAYSFLSPVFESVSKPGYKGKNFDISTCSGRQSKLIALGGIQADNCKQALELGYDGVAVLGAIWQSKSPVETFNQISELCSTIDR